MNSIIATARPPFLVLTLTSVFLALAWVEYNQLTWNAGLLFLVSIGALFAHISVNMLNEYEDFQSGLDDMTARTPFSGGSGSLQKNPLVAEKVAKIGYALLGAVISIGVFFIYLRGWAILPIGLLGVIIIFTYTSWITRFPLICLFSSGLAFGPLMVNGAYFVLTGRYDFAVFVISLIPFFLVNNLLLLNQIPDVEADEKVGRYNVLHKYSLRTGLRIYIVNWLFAFGIVALLLIMEVLPLSVLLTGIALLLSVPLLLALFKSQTDRLKLNTALALNVALTLLTPTLISFGLFI